jgi:hypothetical protein
MPGLEDFLAEIGVASKGQVAPAVQQPQKPKLKPIVFNRPKAPVTPTAPKPWQDTSWLPEKLPGFSEEEFPAIGLEDLGFPDEEPEATESVYNVESVDGADDYLRSLPSNQKLLETLDAIYTANEQVALDEDKKQLADALGSVMAKLNYIATFWKFDENNRFQHTSTIGKDKTIGLKAVNTLIAYFDGKIKTMLNKGMQDRANDKFLKAKNLESTKRKDPLPLTSQWHGPSLIFINNRTIMIMKNEGINYEEAEVKAKAEWENINKTIDAAMQSASQKAIAQGKLDTSDEEKEIQKNDSAKTFAQELLGGASFEEAADQVKGLIDQGKDAILLRKVRERYQNLKVIDSESEVWDKVVSHLTSDKAVITQLKTNGVPEADATKLAKDIRNLGRLSNDIKKLAGGYVEGMTPSDEVIEQAQETSDAISRLAMRVLTSKYTNIEGLDNVFKAADVIWKSAGALSENLGVESLINYEISSGEELRDSNLVGHQDPTAKKEIDPNAPKRIRNKEVDDKSRERHMNRIRAMGNLSGYLAKRRKQRDNRSDDQKKLDAEKNRIRNPDYIKTNEELNKWKYLALIPGDHRNEINKLRKISAKKTLDLYRRMSKTWLPKKEVDEIERDLIKRMEYNFSKTLSEITKTQGSNPGVIKALEEEIAAIPKYFEIAKAQIENEKTNYASVIFDFADSFAKYSNAS